MLLTLKRHLSNIPGWRSNRKLVVFESDDWGSIRMPDSLTYEKAKNSSLDLFSGEGSRYNSLDALESAADIEALTTTLQGFTDKKGNAPKFTLIVNTGNPDFERIKALHFKEFIFEDFYTTYKRFGLHQTLDKIKEGISKNVLFPQFHGREHLNATVWLHDLQKGDEAALKGFELGIWGFNNKHPLGISYQAAFDVANPLEIDTHKQILANGLDVFENVFGYKARYFVPPNGPLNFGVLPILSEKGIDILAVGKRQQEPLGNGRYQLRKHHLGMQNKYGQIYITRNATFEPSDKQKDWVSACMESARIAFLWRKPLVISTHRVNYVGGIDESNRSNGCLQLKILLQHLLKQWPDIEFMSSVELADTIRKKHDE